MASEFADRIKAIEAAGVTVHGHQTTKEAPRWLRHALEHDAVHVTEISGLETSQALVVMTLARLEQLVAEAYL